LLDFWIVASQYIFGLGDLFFYLKFFSEPKTLKETMDGWMGC